MSEIREEFNRHIRNDFIKEHPLCQYCGKQAEQVHHLIPIAKGGDNRQSNLIPLCTECHCLVHYDHKDLSKSSSWTTNTKKPNNRQWKSVVRQWQQGELSKAGMARACKVCVTTINNWLKADGLY